MNSFIRDGIIFTESVSCPESKNGYIMSAGLAELCLREGVQFFHAKKRCSAAAAATGAAAAVAAAA